MTLSGLYLVFCKFGLLCFGGGYMLIPLLTSELVGEPPRPLAPREEVCLNLDLRQCGLGKGSCARNQTMEKYRFPAVPEKWTLLIEPAARRVEVSLPL